MSHAAAAGCLLARGASRRGMTAAAAGWRRWCGGGSISASSDDANNERDVSISDNAAAVASSSLLPSHVNCNDGRRPHVNAWRWGSPPTPKIAGRGFVGGGSSRFSQTATAAVPTTADEVCREGGFFSACAARRGGRVVKCSVKRGVPNFVYTCMCV